MFQFTLALINALPQSFLPALTFHHFALSFANTLSALLTDSICTFHKSVAQRHAVYHTCNTDNILVSWTSFDALRFELSQYERSGRLIFGSDHPGRRF